MQEGVLVEHTQRLKMQVLVAGALAVLGWMDVTQAEACTKALAEKTLETLYAGAKDHKKAYEMIHPCAKRGDAKSQIVLSLILTDRQKGNPYYDQACAFRWLKKAAEQGHREAQWKYGQALAQARGTRDEQREYEREAMTWLRKAAEQGHPMAMHEIATYYRSYTPDSVSAYMWYTLAARRFKDDSEWKAFSLGGIRDLNESRHVSKEDIQAALKRADQWEKEHPQASGVWPSDDWLDNMTSEE